MSNLNTLSVLDNLDIALLTDWNNVSSVRKITKGRKLMDDINQLNIDIPMTSKPIHNLIYRESYIGDDERVANIQNTSVIGGNLVADLNPINGNPVTFFREGDVLFGNSKQIQGIVVQSTAGQVVIKPSAGSTAATLFSSMPVGSDVQTIGLYKPFRNSSGVEGLNRVPEIQLNYLSLMRDGSQWNRVDMHKARVESAGKYWVYGQISQALQRMLTDIERSYMWGLPQAPDAQDMSRNGGIDWAIRNRGGNVVQFSALPTQGQFNDWLKQIFQKRPYYIRLKKLYMGNALYTHIQNNFTTGYIRQIDPKGVQTGEINENANKYMVGGFEVDLVTNLGLFLEGDYDKVLTTGVGMTGMKKEWSCYCIDQDPVAIEGGGEVPAIEKIHFSDSPFYIGRSTGIGDCPVGMPSGEMGNLNVDNYMVSTSAVDRSEIHFMYHGGVNMITGEYSGIFEAAI